ncbi:hypothetical protein BS47DRAFT_1362880 [Hydnum rufescens UP504]|uniref:Uncharacterized protein n=1 Tax=Hydnum rufescens UP504 TaxID=1448309 RepID=A0A9P6AW14_9AGAM|nr:hypothetical protein BS47DRAFT_1362880 [Hydnum rufescens UP504]
MCGNIRLSPHIRGKAMRNPRLNRRLNTKHHKHPRMKWITNPRPPNTHPIHDDGAERGTTHPRVMVQVPNDEARPARDHTAIATNENPWSEPPASETANDDTRNDTKPHEPHTRYRGCVVLSEVITSATRQMSPPLGNDNAPTN